MREKTASTSRFAAKWLREAATGVLAAVTLVLTMGFALFAHSVSVMPNYSFQSADAIVALTGGEDRIAEAVRLLAWGKARRLLISGVNRTTSKPELISLNALGGRDAVLFQCCVDLDKRALNTVDNAMQTAAWVRSHGFRSLIVVTSNYHMPRSLIELRQDMPDVEMIPYPVRSPALETRWWSDRRTIWVLVKEYLKFMRALARFEVNSLLHGGIGNDKGGRTIDARLD